MNYLTEVTGCSKVVIVGDKNVVSSAFGGVVDDFATGLWMLR